MNFFKGFFQAVEKPSQVLSKIINKNDEEIVIFVTHGHHGIYDLIFGTIIDKVRHQIDIPILLAK